jgi:hypothetical protein
MITTQSGRGDLPAEAPAVPRAIIGDAHPRVLDLAVDVLATALAPARTAGATRHGGTP